MKKQRTENNDLAQLVSEFFESYLPKERGVSKHTVRSYSNTFLNLYKFFKETKEIPAHKLTVTNLSRESIIDYLNWLEESENNTISTRNARLAGIKTFCQFAQYKDISQISRWQKILSLKSKRTDRPIVSFLTQEGMKTLLSAVPTDTVQGRRHLALLAFMYDTGARASEIINFAPISLNLTKPYHIVLFGKGRKKRIVPINDRMVEILKAYMYDRHIEIGSTDKQPLFVNNHGRKLTTAGLSHIIKMYADLVREEHPDLIPERLSPHSFRHSKATHLLQAGLNIIYVRDFLGHSSIKTTEVYVRLDSEQKRKALEAAASEIVPTSGNGQDWNKDEDLIKWLKSLGR